jgi:hypothetical protein
MPTDPPIEYLEPGVEGPAKKRSAKTWAKLLLVWAVGLVVWTIYLVAIAYLVLKLL